MIDIISKKCIKCNKIQPSFNYQNETKPTHCFKCKLSGMVVINNYKCSENLCNIKPSTPLMKIFGMCSDHARFHHPNHEYFKNKYKQRQLHVQNYFDQDFQDLNLIHDHRISCQDCTLTRPDTFLDLASHIITLECDEKQHYAHDKEQERLEAQYIALGERPMVVIRFQSG